MWTRKGLSRALLCCLLLSAVGAWTACNDDGGWSPTSPFTESYVEEFEHDLDASGVTHLDLRTVNGDIETDGEARTTIFVHIRKEVRSNSASEAERFAQEVEVELERVGDEIRVSSRYPQPPRTVQVLVSYAVDCPRGIDLSPHSINGELRIAGMESSIQASVINGSIDASFDNLARACGFSVTNGRVDVEVRSGGAPLSVECVNASARVALHQGFAGYLDARTVHGRVDCRMPLAHTQVRNRNRVVGRLGNGGPNTVFVRCVNGNIDLDPYAPR